MHFAFRDDKQWKLQQVMCLSLSQNDLYKRKRQNKILKMPYFKIILFVQFTYYKNSG